MFEVKLAEALSPSTDTRLPTFNVFLMLGVGYLIPDSKLGNLG